MFERHHTARKVRMSQDVTSHTVRNTRMSQDVTGCHDMKINSRWRSFRPPAGCHKTLGVFSLAEFAMQPGMSLAVETGFRWRNLPCEQDVTGSWDVPNTNFPEPCAQFPGSGCTVWCHNHEQFGDNGCTVWASQSCTFWALQSCTVCR